MTYAIEPFILPDSFRAAEPLLAEQAALSSLIQREAWGHDDYRVTARGLWQNTAPDGLFDTRRWFVRRDGQMIGWGVLALPLVDNLQLAHVGGGVHPDARREGVGTAIAELVEAEAAAAGRTSLLASTWHGRAELDEADQVNEPMIVSDDGEARLPVSSAGVSFMVERGYRLVLSTRSSVAEPDIDLLQRLAAEASGPASDYRIVRWHGRVPDKWIGQIAELYETMSTDIPLGDMELEHETWTGDRIRVMERHDVANGRTAWLTGAVDDDERMVAFTLLYTRDDLPQKGEQEETLVLDGHRGHRLGLMVKCLNMIAAMRAEPRLARIYTWNAVQNGPMLAINTAVGFHPDGASANWQKAI